jgi:16S rRNA A1518/A1519 N6-dimethyltransferase RsmA/KsgA/DIM1 with predicted DNA glycosylase/AP lyase activity
VPSVESAILTVVPRAVPLLSPAAFKGYESFLTRVFSGRAATRSNLPPDAYARAFRELRPRW